MIGEQGSIEGWRHGVYENCKDVWVEAEEYDGGMIDRKWGEHVVWGMAFRNLQLVWPGRMTSFFHQESFKEFRLLYSIPRS